MMLHQKLPANAVFCRFLIVVFFGLPLSWGLVSAQNAKPTTTAADLQAQLKNRLETIRPQQPVVVQGQVLASPYLVRIFYHRQHYLPVWGTAGSLGRAVADLLAALEQLRQEALVPEDYHLESLKHLYREVQSSGLLQQAYRLQLLVDLELLATDAFFTSASHLSSGRIAPETLGPDQQAVHKEADLIGALEAAAESGRVQPVLNSLLPDHDGYRRLRATLRRYRQIADKGGWKQLADGALLQAGRDDLQVPLLRSRLAAEGYLDRRQLGGATRFDPVLKQAVEAFQRQHGLVVDGAVGPLTRAALNVPVQQRVRQIELNMERWRWLPRYLGKRYLLVNIADFTMEIVDGSRPVMTMRVAVGKDYRRTPVFSAQLTKMVFNPYWYVPPTIFAEDLLPAIQKNPDMLGLRGYKLFSRLGSGGEEVDPGSIDWQGVDPNNFPYILRKDPGPSNPMGRAKFLFPNRFDVYLHDSPDRGIFTHPKRTFSSGCIRIEKPIELATYLLKDDRRWSRRRILEEIATGRSKIVRTFDPLPIHIQYWTAWVEPDGSVQFREDIYGRDAALEEALFTAEKS